MCQLPTGVLLWCAKVLSRRADFGPRQIRRSARCCVAVDEFEVFLKSFEGYVDGLDRLSDADLQFEYEVARRRIIDDSTAAHVRHGAQSLMVIILGEMIRREDESSLEQKLDGYQRAHRMLRLEGTVWPE